MSSFLNALYRGAEITIIAVYTSAGLMKLTMPIEKIGNVWSWTAQVMGRESFVT